MSLRGLPLLLLLALAFCATAPVATAAVLAVGAEGPAVTDGRTIAFSPQPGTIRVVTGAVARDVGVEATCNQSPVQLYAIGAGQVLFGCGDAAFPVPQRLDLATMDVQPVPGAAELIEANGESIAPWGVSFKGIGAVGVSFLSSGYHWAVLGAVDWRTGASVHDSPDATRVLDLDRPELTTTLCAPLHRIATGPGAETSFWPFQYRAPYGLSQTGRLVLHRCASARRVVLSRRASGPQLGTRLVTWIETLGDGAGRYRADAYALACGARVSWPVRWNSRIAPLARSVVISQPAGDSGLWRIRQVAVRGICRHAAPRR